MGRGEAPWNIPHTAAGEQQLHKAEQQQSMLLLSSSGCGPQLLIQPAWADGQHVLLLGFVLPASRRTVGLYQQQLAHDAVSTFLQQRALLVVVEVEALLMTDVPIPHDVARFLQLPCPGYASSLPSRE